MLTDTYHWRHHSGSTGKAGVLAENRLDFLNKLNEWNRQAQLYPNPVIRWVYWG